MSVETHGPIKEINLFESSHCNKVWYDNEYGADIVIKQDISGNGRNDTLVTDIIRNEQPWSVFQKQPK